MERVWSDEEGRDPCLMDPPLPPTYAINLTPDGYKNYYINYQRSIR